MNTSRVRERRKAYAPISHQLGRLFFSQNVPNSMKVVHQRPNVYVIENFLTEKEHQYLCDLVRREWKRFRPSYTENPQGVQQADSERTSSFIHLLKAGSAVIRQIEHRASSLVGMSVQNVEPLQIVRYKPGEFFGLHHDMGTYNESTKTVTADSPRRVITMFVYLNTLKGGHTVFPELDLRVQPNARLAVLWCNVLKDGEPDPRMIHYAAAVDNVKCGLNIWITDKSQQHMIYDTKGAK